MLVTRAATDAAELVDGLRAIGCDVVVVALIERQTVPHAFDEPGDLLLITSAAAAEAVAAGMAADRRPARSVAVGPASAAACERLGIAVEIVGDGTGEALVAALGDLRGVRVLYPHAEDATAATAVALEAARATLIDVVCYRNVAPAGAIAALTAAAPWDLVTLTSASAARRYAEGCAAAGVPLGPAVVIGPSTAEAAARAGIAVIAVADRPAVAALVAAVAAWRPAGIRGAARGE